MDNEALRLALTKIITELEAIHQLLEKQGDTPAQS